MTYTSFNQAWADYVLTYAQERTSYDNMTFYIGAIGASATWQELRGNTAAACSTMRNWLLLHGRTQNPTWQESSYYSALYFAGQGGAAIAMADILSAMLAATSDELTNFIGIEQAYMAAIWNAPYNGEYYAALARGFRKWP